MKERVIEYLSQSKISILIAVSWLTDLDIINILQQKSSEGVLIKILLSASEWNILRFHEFETLKNLGVIIHKRGARVSGKGNFMHCKFSVIDEKFLVHGSYNWTKLGNTNDENLEVIEDYGKARQYTITFHTLFKDSIDYFDNLDDVDIQTLIKRFEDMENNNIDPTHDDSIKSKNEQNEISKVNSSLNTIKIISIKTLEQLREISLKNSEKIDFIGEIYVYSYKYEDKNESSFLVSSNKEKYYTIRIKNHFLSRALIKGNDDFSILYNRLGGIPSFLLTFLLQRIDFEVVVAIEIDNQGRYWFSLTKNDKISFKLRGHDTNYALYDRNVKLGESYLDKIIKGEKLKEDLEKEFQIINWL